MCDWVLFHFFGLLFLTAVEVIFAITITSQIVCAYLLAFKLPFVCAIYLIWFACTIKLWDDAFSFNLLEHVYLAISELYNDRSSCSGLAVFFLIPMGIISWGYVVSSIQIWTCSYTNKQK